MDVDVRQLHASEVEAAVDLFIQAYANAPWRETWSYENAKERLREISQTPGWLGVGAFESDTIVGLSLGVPHTSSAGKALYVSELVVRPSHQKRGNGTRLIEKLQKLAREEGFRSAWLVSQSSGDLSKFYVSNRYIQSQRLSVYSLKLASSGT